MIRLGKEPKGIIGSGIVRTLPFLSKHWSGEDKMVNRVIIEFDTILDADTEPILDLATLQDSEILSGFNWTPQSSGIQIPEIFLEELSQLWSQYSSNTNNNLNREFQDFQDERYLEGAQRQVIVTRHERNPEARKRCIEHYGAKCVCCDLEFVKAYGDIGAGFIHVHHLERISDVGCEYEIDPIEDLRPVCPNCHAMIHKQTPPLTIDDIKECLSSS